MKYYSESLHKVFDSEAELKVAEASQEKRNKGLIAAGKELATARDNFKKAQDNCDKAREAYVAAVRKYRTILEQVETDKTPTPSVSDEEFQKIIKKLMATFDAFNRW